MKISFDSKFFRVSEQIVDMLFVSILWVICCIPVLTVIPATIALYYAAAKVIRRETGHILPEFFRALWENMRQGIGLSFLYAFLAVVLYSISRFAKTYGIATPLGGFYYAFFLLLLLFLACITYYLLPILSRFSLSLMSGLRLSIYFGMKNLGTMIPLIITFAGAVAAVYVFPFLIVIVPGFYAFLMTKPIEKTFRSYIRDEMPNPEAHYGMWYMDEPADGAKTEE